MIIAFDENLLTGNATIDEQHKELFQRIERFGTLCENNGGKIEAINMLTYLSDYTNFHFSAEEELQKNADYPAYDEHVAKHISFKKALVELEEFLEDLDGPTDEFVEAVQKNVVDWFINHIQTFDRSVAEYLNVHSNGDLL